MRGAALLFAAVAALATPAAPAFDPKPWLDDLEQTRTAFAGKYANLEWAVSDRGADLDDYFARARKRIAAARDDGSARAAFDGLVRRLGDGHVEIEWPVGPGPSSAAPSNVCTEAGFDGTKSGAPLAALAHGYSALVTPQSKTFPAGIIVAGRHRIGVLKIGLFSAEGTPELCRAAVAALAIAPAGPCDDACLGRIGTWTDARMTEDLIAQVQALKRARIEALLVDVTGNGGGSEWAEAAMRILTPVRLKSERVDFVRGAQWAKEFADAEAVLRAAAKTAPAGERAFLLKLADAARQKRAVAETPCDPTPLWRHEHPVCAWLGHGFFGSGLIAAADPADLRGKNWAATVFTPMEYPYREGVWRGSLIVLVDGETWSAAEEFAAVLQDNRAAFIIGEATGGAGCGHTDGSEPVTLTHSGGKLELPDCARIRADGSNEVRGIAPDLSIGWRRHDGPELRAATLQARLPQALAQASELAIRRR